MVGLLLLGREYAPNARRVQSGRVYIAKAQLKNYESVRAQFEAFNAHMDAANASTGVIYWMLNNVRPGRKRWCLKHVPEGRKINSRFRYFT